MRRSRNDVPAGSCVRIPTYSDALLELANLRMTEKKYAEAEELLRKYVKVSHEPGDWILQAGDGRAQSA